VTSERALRTELSAVAKSLHARGFCANHEGNVTARLERGRFLATPGAVSKRLCEPDALVVLDEKGAVASGRGKSFSEAALHLAVYRVRADVGAVVHAHPPYATAFACAGRALDRPILAEAVVSLGAEIPLVPFSAPGEAAVAALAPFLERFDAVLLGSHGVLAWGDDLEQASLRLEHVEQVARICQLAEPLGGARALPAEALPALLEARRKAFPRLAKAAPSGPPVSARPTATVIPSASPDLARIIAEELASALRGR